MKQRDMFYLILGALGAISGIGQWLLFRHLWSSLDGIAGLVFFLLLPLTFVVPYIFERYLPLFAVRFLARLGGYWFVAMYYLSLGLVPAFFLWLILWLSGHNTLWLQLAPYYAGLLLLLVAISLLCGAWRATHPIYRRLQLRTEKPLARPVTLAFASDIHLGLVLGRAFGKKLVADMNRIQPDLILLGGDLIDGNYHVVKRDDAFYYFNGFQPRVKTIAVFGNHDHYAEEIPAEKKLLQAKGLQILEGETTQPLPGLGVTGMTDFIYDPGQKIPQAPADVFSIFMEHEPMHPRQAAAAGYDLYLAGHTHAGQFWPNRLATRRIFDLDFGTKKYSQLTAIVSSGYGSWGPLFRLGPKPEIVVISVNPKL